MSSAVFHYKSRRICRHRLAILSRSVAGQLSVASGPSWESLWYRCGGLGCWLYRATRWQLSRVTQYGSEQCYIINKMRYMVSSSLNLADFVKWITGARHSPRTSIQEHTTIIFIHDAFSVHARIEQKYSRRESNLRTVLSRLYSTIHQPT